MTCRRLMTRIAPIALALFALMPGMLRAADADSLTITIRPNAYYAVDIDTANVSMDLGTVGLGLSTQTVSPATVTIQSTFAQTELQIHGSIDSLVPWSFDADTSDQNPDQLAAWATFTTVARTSAPVQSGGYFSGTVPGAANSDVISTTTRYVGTGGGGTNLFEANGEFAYKDMNDLPPDPDPLGKSHLWLYFRLPNATTEDDPQNITITITATAPN